MKLKLFSLAIAALSLAACHNNSTDSSTGASSSMDSTTHTDTAAMAHPGGTKNDSTASSSNQPAMKDDSTFLIKANDIGMFEIKIGQLAQTNSQNANVKDMANMMIQDHTAMGKDVMGQAKNESIMLPSSLSDDMQKEYDKLSKLNGKNFDKEYADVNVKGHKEAISLFEKTSTDKDCSPAVQQLASAGLPKLKQHKEHSDMLKTQVKM